MDALGPNVSGLFKQLSGWPDTSQRARVSSLQVRDQLMDWMCNREMNIYSVSGVQSYWPAPDRAWALTPCMPPCLCSSSPPRAGLTCPSSIALSAASTGEHAKVLQGPVRPATCGDRCASLPLIRRSAPCCHHRFRSRMEERKPEWAVFPESWRVPQVGGLGLPPAAHQHIAMNTMVFVSRHQRVTVRVS